MVKSYGRSGFSPGNTYLGPLVTSYVLFPGVPTTSDREDNSAVHPTVHVGPRTRIPCFAVR